MDPRPRLGNARNGRYLAHCLGKVSEQFPGAPKMYIGHISARRGGHLSPHVSHQAGRDVDISYYYLPGQSHWYAVARANNLDRERTWAFVKALITDTDIELILMDRAVQRLRARATPCSAAKTAPGSTSSSTAAASLPPLIRHAKGHATHLHVRFYNPLAQETGRRAYELLLKRRIIAAAVGITCTTRSRRAKPWSAWPRSTA